MSREIDILTWYLREGFVAVEKTTNQTWTLAELLEFSPAQHLHGEDRIRPPEPGSAVSAPYPGCQQQSGATPTARDFKLVGQTRHFLVFEPGT